MPIGYREGQRTSKGTLVTKKILDSVARDDATTLEIQANNTEQIKAAIGDAVIAALTEMGMSCEAFAKQKCPVDTGRLRNSITWQLSSGENAVYIGTNVEYAYSVHEGTGTNRSKGARPFLKDAAANHEKLYQDILKEHMGGTP